MEDGWTVVFAGRDVQRLTAVTTELQGTRGAAEPYRCDVVDVASIAALVAHTVDTHGCPDLWVNNAGIAGRTVSSVDLARDEWDEVLAVNLTGPMLCAQAVLPGMIDRGSGHILNIASITGKQPLAQRAAYAASKLGLIGLTRSLAAEVGRLGVRVNAISPGLVSGPRIERVLAGQARARGVGIERVRADLVAATPMGRMVTPEEVAEAVVALHSLTAVTGADLNVAAGLAMS